MGLKDILVVLDNSDRSDARLQLTTALARRSGAYLIGICPQAAFYPEPEPAQALSGFPLGVVSEPIEQAAAQLTALRARRVEDVLLDALKTSGLQGTWHDDPSAGIDDVVGLARGVDLVVMGQSDPTWNMRAAGRSLPEQVMMDAGRPVLFVPYAGPAQAPFKRVLIGWDGSRTAARAVNDALPLLSDADEITVLAVDPPPPEPGRTSAAAIAAHLARHGFPAAARVTISDGVPIADIILNEASDLGADLLVIGGYGHSRSREHLFGGVTLDLLRTMTLPVLMSH